MQISVELDVSTRLVTEVNEVHAACARSLLERLRPNALSLASNARNETGIEWAALELRRHEGLVEISEPDYLHDPSRFVRSLDVTCAVFAAQQRLLEQLNLTRQAAPVSVQQYVRVTNAALEATSVLAWHSVDREAPFTGWQFASTVNARQAADEEAGLYSVRELASLRIAWLVGLVLPAGWTCRYVGNTLLDCVGPDGQTHPVYLSLDL